MSELSTLPVGGRYSAPLEPSSHYRLGLRDILLTFRHARSIGVFLEVEAAGADRVLASAHALFGCNMDRGIVGVGGNWPCGRLIGGLHLRGLPREEATGDSSMERKWARAGVEPLLSELMSDPIVHLLMLRDNITSGDVWGAIRVYRELQHQAQAHDPVIINNMVAVQTSPNCPRPPSLRVCVEKADAMSGPSPNRGGGSATATHQKTAPMHDKKGHTLRVGVRRSTSK